MFRLARNSVPNIQTVVEPSSPKLTASPELKTSPVKRGFKPNNSAAFLRKRSDLPETPSDDGRSAISLPSLGRNLSEEEFTFSNTLKVRSMDNQGRQLSLTSTTDASLPEINRYLDDQSVASQTHIDESTLPHKLYRAMVVGSEDIEKIKLVNSLLQDVPSDESMVEKERKFDLVIKKVVENSEVKHFNFWIKQAAQVNEVEKRKKIYKEIYNIYYKTSSLIFLVYRENDRNSFVALKEELNSISNFSEICKNSRVMLLKVRAGSQTAPQHMEVEFEQEESDLLSQYNINFTFNLDENTKLKDLLVV